jgi:copper chaperone CopZ
MIREETHVSFFQRIFGQRESKKEAYPVVPEGMKGVMMKGIGMHCTYRCKPRVESALKDVDGIEDYKVDIPPKDQAFVIYDPTRTNPDIIREAIIESGYDVKDVVALSQ